jgi:hypothetical protein
VHEHHGEGEEEHDEADDRHEEEGGVVYGKDVAALLVVVIRADGGAVVPAVADVADGDLIQQFVNRIFGSALFSRLNVYYSVNERGKAVVDGGVGKKRVVPNKTRGIEFRSDLVRYKWVFM